MPSSALILFAHPAPHQSRVNRRLADAARGVAGATLHDLYEHYPDFYIDVAREQALVMEADLLVFMHPVHWYSMPALLKEWVDTVLESGWAHGEGGTALHGKRYWLVASTGSPADAYAANGIHGRPFDDYMVPFRQTAALCGMQWQPPLVLHGAQQAGDGAIDAHAAAFRQALQFHLSQPATPPHPTRESAANGT